MQTSIKQNAVGSLKNYIKPTGFDLTDLIHMVFPWISKAVFLVPDTYKKTCGGREGKPLLYTGP